MDLTIGKCVFPGCRVTGQVVPGRPYACAMHTAWIVTGYKGLKNVAAAMAKRTLVKRTPWWAKAFIEGAKDAG